MSRKRSKRPNRPQGRTSTAIRPPKRSQAFLGAPRSPNPRARALKSIVPRPRASARPRGKLHPPNADFAARLFKKPRERPHPEPVAQCIGCGCDDNNACLAFGLEPCHWISVNRPRGVGVCSECAIKMFNAILFPEESDVEIHRSIMAAARA